MVEKLRKRIAVWLAPEYKMEAQVLRAINKDWEKKINQRVAKIISELDPVDLLMKEYNGIFSKDFDRAEERLDERSRIEMYMWGWRQKHDPCFEHMVNWIMDSAGNETMKGKILDENFKSRMLYGRAQISNMILLKKEVGRLSSLYEEILEEKKGKEFDSSVGVE